MEFQDTRADELKTGDTIYLDGQRRKVHEASPHSEDPHRVRLVIDGFTTPFTIPNNWTYPTPTFQLPPLTSQEVDLLLEITGAGEQRLGYAETAEDPIDGGPVHRALAAKLQDLSRDWTLSQPQ
ncbi:hypothetical protein OG689_44375 [Kitasatospora sp. NBC_00240]|uniref:hypothetical protein n=1 Tax=Kitasatospora sp. NBC_00240 TaxID=2903567 RepID=UPI0022599982|nr:hypothetical protein [Kitasatospora sp. NBC_00240]MCX5216175.1 hypothetical protein [Kitasatospora sp. NBC_00240]